MRPWIKINPMSATKGESKDHIRAWKECKSTDNIDTIWFTCVIENIGGLPAKDMLIKTCHLDSQFNKKNFHELNHVNTKTSLLPGEDHHLNIQIPWKQFNTLNKNPIYYGVHVRYSYNDDKYESIGKIFKLFQNSVGMPEYWHDEPPNMEYD